MFTIVHPTDLSPDEQRPFAHAVALASRGDARLIALHADRPGAAPAAEVQARPLLQLWGRDLEMPFRFVRHACCDDPIDTALDALRGQTADMLVVGTHQRGGLERVLKDSFSEAIARETSLPTLFVPIAGRGLVDEETGALSLRHVLIPVESEAVQPALDAAAQLLERAEVEACEVTLLHVGECRARLRKGVVVRLPSPISLQFSVEEEEGPSRCRKNTVGELDLWMDDRNEVSRMERCRTWRQADVVRLSGTQAGERRVAAGSGKRRNESGQ